MEPQLIPYVPELHIAATGQLNEKPRQGVESWNPAPNPDIDERNCTAAIGLRASLRWNGVGPFAHDRSYDLTNPQSLNRYVYVLNNPLTFTDQSGLDCNVVVGGIG